MIWRTKKVRFLNFFPFYVRGGKKDITIEFPEEVNTYVLLGDNGMGKSTMTRNLNPLPRYDMEDLIIEKAEGLKEVYLTNTEAEFDLKCMIRYIPAKSKGKHVHNIKAHLFKIDKKLGTEKDLNENGNVGSYIELIENFMNLGKDLRRLLVISQDDIGVTGETTSKRRQLMKGFTPNIDSLDKITKGLVEEHSILKRDLTATETKLSNYPSHDSLKLVYDECDRKYKEIDSALSDLSESIGALSTANERKGVLEDKLNGIESKIRVCVSADGLKFDGILGDETERAEFAYKHIMEENMRLKMDRNNIAADIQRIKDTAKKMDTSRLKTELEHLEDRIDKKRVDNTDMPPCDDVDAINDLILAVKTTDIMRDGMVDKSKRLSMTRFDELEEMDIDEVNKLLSDTSQKIDIVDNNLGNLDIETTTGGLEVLDLEVPSECKIPKCPAKVFLEEMQSKATEYHNRKESIEKMRDKLIELDTIYNEVELYLEIKEEFQSIYDNLETHRETIEAIGGIKYEEVITKDNLLIDNKYMDNVAYLIARCEEVKRQLSVMEDIKRYNEVKAMIEISDSSGSSTSTLYLTENISALNIKIEKSDKDLINAENYNDRMKCFFASHILYMDRKEIDKEKANLLKEKIATENELVSISKSVESLNDAINNREEMSVKREELKVEITDLSNKLNIISTLENEMKKLKVNEREAAILRETGAKKLPVRIISSFLDDIKITANEFLALTDMPYRFNKFTVTETDFIIEILNGEHVIKDISIMSSGERYLLGILLNFAIQNRSLGSYRDIILDEVDSPLKSTNRHKFFKMLLRRNDIHETGNTFIISHNTEIHKHAQEGIGYILFKGADNVPDNVNVIWSAD